MYTMLNAKQLEALEIVQNGHSLYIGGQAGVGKTYLVKHIFNDAKRRGKAVHLTCTTGIACSNYPQMMNVVTIHKWSGIGDGRYTGRQLLELLHHDEQRAGAKERILATDILIIDEISMMSRAMFENLYTVCAVKNNTEVFGGIQLILVGDFLQLPPVRNVRYGDFGEYAFVSYYWPNHSIYLNEVIRQKNETLINCIQSISLGNLNPEDISYIHSLSRHLPPQPDTVYLFASNILVDMFNRDCLLRMEGKLFIFDAIDSGKEKCLNELVVQKTLWLKINTSVMLLRNLSEKLVNGLCGQVRDISDESITVFFPSVDVTTDIRRISFTVFNPKTNSNIAERFQFPLKLAYARTVHKAQGMTLNRVQIDCRHIFQPGQLGVAMGRVTTAEGLGIVNFSPDAVIKQPAIVTDFLCKESTSLSSDLSCCFNKSDQVTVNVDKQLDSSAELSVLENDEISEDLNESESELDELLEIVNADLQTFGDSDLPADFNTEIEVNALKFIIPENTFQESYNSFVDYLIVNKGMLTKFCANEWKTLSKLFEDNVSNSEINSAVTQSHLQLFYQKCQEHMTSMEYKSACFEIFDPNETDLNVEFSVCFNLVVLLRKVLLKKKTEKLQFETTRMHQRVILDKGQMNETARGKVRFIGGYVVAKLRHDCIKKINSNVHKTSSSAIALYEQSKLCLQVLDCVKQSEQTLIASSKDIESLKETSRKQNVNRSLTNINDNAFYFFTKIIDQSLQLLNGTNFSKYGPAIYEFIIAKLLTRIDLYEQFLKLCTCTCKCKISSESGADTIHGILEETLFKVTVFEELYEKVLHKLVSVLTKQFTRDALLALSVTKKMEHRKQIQVSVKKGSSTCMNILDFSSIQGDLSKNKIATHCMLKANLSQGKQVLQNFTVKQLLLLCKAYNCKAKGKKSQIISTLQENIEKEDNMNNPDVLSVCTAKLEPKEKSEFNTRSEPSNENVDYDDELLEQLMEEF